MKVVAMFLVGLLVFVPVCAGESLEQWRERALKEKAPETLEEAEKLRKEKEREAGIVRSSPIIGYWRGTAKEKSKGQTIEYPVHVHIERLRLGFDAGGAWYPSQKCPATLYLMKEERGWWTFYEESHAQCASGYIRVRLSEQGDLQWQWYLRTPDTLKAYAFLPPVPDVDGPDTVVPSQVPHEMPGVGIAWTPIPAAAYNSKP